MRRLVALVLLLVPAASAGATGNPASSARSVTYVPSIVSVPTDAHWGKPISYVVDVRSRAGQATTVPVGLLLYLSDPAGRRVTSLGVVHRMLRLPANGTAEFTYRATAPARPSDREVCLGVTLAGDSSGAFVCSEVT